MVTWASQPSSVTGPTAGPYFTLASTVASTPCECPADYLDTVFTGVVIEELQTKTETRPENDGWRQADPWGWYAGKPRHNPTGSTSNVSSSFLGVQDKLGCPPEQ